MHSRTIVERFWKKVNKDGPVISHELGPCWIWTGAKAARRYGQVIIDGRNFGTHRVAWLLTFGQIPEGQRVCHRCDNPPCVNPSHLFVGTQQDNIDDMRAKGRHSKFRLDGTTAINIVNRRRSGESLASIAAAVGVSASCVSLVCAGLRWSHVTGIEPTKK